MLPDAQLIGPGDHAPIVVGGHRTQGRSAALGKRIKLTETRSHVGPGVYNPPLSATQRSIGENIDDRMSAAFRAEESSAVFLAQRTPT